jgi:TM2 domain-containing membrane protein YozV
MGLPEAVRIASAKLDPKMQKAFARDFAKRKKSLIGPCVAWLFLGWHYLYLGKIGLQFAFWITFGGVFFWWLRDFFRLPGIVALHNEDMARRLMAEYRMMA